jgi:hypothetical protein
MVGPMMRRLLGLVLFWPLSAAAEDITKVTVLDAEFRLIRTITSAPDLAAFGELWVKRTMQGPDVAMRPAYKIDIHSAGRSYRWLYDPAGLAQTLSKKKSPVYRLSSPAAFNELLAIESN